MIECTHRYDDKTKYSDTDQGMDTGKKAILQSEELGMKLRSVGEVSPKGEKLFLVYAENADLYLKDLLVADIKMENGQRKRK